jgi:LysM repeat protein
VSAAAWLVLAAIVALPAAADDPPFDLKTFSSHTTDTIDAPYTVAGGHPDQNVTEFSYTLSETKKSPILDVDGSLQAATLEDPNSTYVRPPLGFIGNPAAAPRCELSKVKDPDASGTGITDCPPGSRVGVAIVDGNTVKSTSPLQNISPEYGYPAQFAFRVTNNITLLSAFLQPRTESYGLTVGTPTIPPVELVAFTSTFFGVPGQQPITGPKDGSGGTEAPFLSNPVDCSDPDPIWSIASDSQQHTGGLLGLGVPDLSDPDWKTDSEPAPPVTGCDDPKLARQFAEVGLGVKPLQPGGGPTQADQPTGLAVDLDFPQSNDPTDPEYIKFEKQFDPSIPQAPPPKDITVKLPAGLSVSPSSADGLGACSDQASAPAGDQVHYDNTKPVTCPDAAKIGSALATSPLLATHDPQTDEVNGAEPIPGDVYLLAPHPGDLPIGGAGQEGKFRLLIQLENPRYGINIKLPGVATADPQTGQLTTVFTQNPQLPASHITVSLKQGARAPLATPVTCGSFQTTSDIVPWSTPGTPDAHPSASFAVGSGPKGSGCPQSAPTRPFSPALVTAGPDSAVAGASSPFTLKLTRADGEQELSSLEATLPKGLAAKFVGIPYCSDAALAAAAGRSGKAEQASSSCPASRIGSVTVGAGPGTNPFNASGTAYLAGPYKGAPMSVAVITPAVAGPFDLGTVVVRNALYVDSETAQGRVVSDPFPKMLDGVPLKLRSIAVRLDRPSFTLNPTNCSAMAVNATITSTDGASASPTVPFQVGGCKALGFKPDLKLSLKGGTKRSDYPALKAVLNYPKGNYANIAKAVVSLPHSEFLAQNHIKTICTRVQFAADQCPKGSIYGYVTATTPLLEKPLEGPLYLRSSSHPLPDLVAALHGQIDVDLVGRIDSKNGGIRTTFDAVPDAPVSKFVLTMQGGKKGLLENSKNLCNSVNRADVKFTAQNGMTLNSKPVLTNSCKKKHGKRGKAAKKGGAGKKAQGSSRTINWLPGLGF